MTVPGNLSSPLLATAAAGAAALELQKSVRFNSGDSASLTKTFASAGNTKTFTFSCWLKVAVSGTQSYGCILNQPSGDDFILYNRVNGTLEIYKGGNSVLTTNARFRDPSAWQHFVFAVDSTQSTASNRFRIYHNGSEITSYSVDNRSSNIAQNSDFSINSANAHNIGGDTSHSHLLDGYMADVYFIDGSQLDPTSFGAYDSNNVWQASTYSGTFGTNGFHLLDFANESTIGHDSSGNENDFTANNLSAEATYDAVAGTHAGKAGISFNGTDAVINLSADADVNPGSGVFTLECYAYALSGGQAAFGIYDGSPGGNGSFVLRRVGSGTLMVERHNAAFDITGAAFSENAWHHVAVTRDSSNNVRLFVDGTQSGSTSTNNTHNYQGTFRLGRDNNAFTNGYISNLRLIKGTCLYTSNFTAPTGNLTNVTNTKLLMAQSTTSATAATVKPSGVTISGSGDSSVIDVLFDVPTNGTTNADSGAGGEISGNYCTINPLGVSSNTPTISDGNLKMVHGASQASRLGTIGVSSGKYYFEVKFTAATAFDGMVGVGNADTNLSSYVGVDANSWGYYYNGEKYHTGSGSNSGGSYGSSWAVGDTLGIALDMDNGAVYFSKNGAYQNSGDPTSGSSKTGAAFTDLSGTIFPALNARGGTQVVNFGQRAFNTAAPSGYKTWNTSSLPTPTIADGSTAFDAKTYTGNDSTGQSISLGFSPDFLWFKARGDSGQHALYDVVRGASKSLVSNGTNAEGTEGGGLSTFDSSGFSLSGDNTVQGSCNGSSRAYVAWAWDGGTSTVSNTDGSITTSVRASQTNGFSVISYTGNNTSGATIGHGLNAAPEFAIFKQRGVSNDWSVYHKAAGATGYLRLNLTDAFTTTSGQFNNTHPSASVITLGSDHNANGPSNPIICYAWAPVAGYSAFGSYTGNASQDGPFVYCGFRPAFILWKRTDSSANWYIQDSTRTSFNPANGVLRPNTTDAELTSSQGQIMDSLSNGFKVKNNGTEHNASGGEYVWACFAENPFQANGGLAR